MAHRHGRGRGRLRGRQRAARMARPRRRRREDDGEDRRQPAEETPEADGARGAAAEGAGRRAVQDHAAGAVELRADRVQARRDGPALQGPRRPAGGSGGDHTGRSPVARGPGCPLHPARRAVLLALPRSAAPRGDAAVGRRSGRGLRGGGRRRQRGHGGRAARGRHARRAHLPREQPQPVVHRRRLRRDRGEAVRAAGRRSVPARVRHGAVRHVRAAPPGSARQGRRAGPRHHEGAAPREPR